jgi:hypothetical protein
MQEESSHLLGDGSNNNKMDWVFCILVIHSNEFN